MVFRYDTGGQWYKGNTHIHTTVSDGGMSYAETAALYASAGYRFLFATDHWCGSHLAGT
jgi:predicted metal-dependent phosphoesterase TrpH